MKREKYTVRYRTQNTVIPSPERKRRRSREINIERRINTEYKEREEVIDTKKEIRKETDRITEGGTERK
jgi:hypothetical protein